jgi:hypothetical protein
MQSRCHAMPLTISHTLILNSNGMDGRHLGFLISTCSWALASSITRQNGKSQSNTDDHCTRLFFVSLEIMFWFVQDNLLFWRSKEDSHLGT